MDQLIKAADEGMRRLIEMFVDKNAGYICCPNLDLYKKDDYWHLGRIGDLAWLQDYSRKA